jgi:hypothetical protein
MNGDDAIPEEDINWSAAFFSRINVGGIWSVPRSGLTFRKLNEKTFVLDHVMPWSPGLTAITEEGGKAPATDKEGLMKFQREDYKVISLRFRAAGIDMSDPKNLLGKGNMKTSNVKLGEGSKSWRDVMS